ncbi:MAG: hypothetical protein M2R45_03265 [Verrucomicrobia subdivision 3 bacterium]|nr:hypothetical protein [Limisphaerales bacterium]MCS1416126.1 hypothetical protein [Limisphaerales bacterium]
MPMMENEILVVAAGPDLEINWPEQIVEIDGLVHDFESRSLPVAFQLGRKRRFLRDLTSDNSPEMVAVFLRPGPYSLRLRADDGVNVRHDDLNVLVRPSASETTQALLSARCIIRAFPGSRLSGFVPSAQTGWTLPSTPASEGTARFLIWRSGDRGLKSTVSSRLACGLG